MSLYPEQDSHIRDKMKVVLDLSNYETKKELEHAAGIDTSNVAAKNEYLALKAEIDKRDVKKLLQKLEHYQFEHFKTNVDELDLGELKTVPVDLKKLNDVVDKSCQTHKIQHTKHKSK